MQVLAADKALENQRSKSEEFSDIFESYYKRLYNYIYYRVNEQYIAEDLTSQVFEKVMFKIDTYCENKSNFEVWLFTIAKNTLNDYFRIQKRRKIFPLEFIEHTISKEKAPEEIILIGEKNEQLKKAVAQLNKRERELVALKFGGNMKNTEIAALLQISESNVGVILCRSMKKLKKLIESEVSL